jgi:hypothetical protein
MTGLFAAAVAGWAGLFLLALAAAAASRRGTPPVPPAGDEPPAVIGELAGGPAMRLYHATLLDLSARGWFRLRLPAQDGAGPAMCELAARRPPEPLTPYERRALAHVAFRAGAHHEVPAPALSDGFQEGEDTFLTSFGHEVTADARDRGLSQPRLRAGTRGLLCAAALVPAVAALAAFAPRYPHSAGLWYILLAYCAACAVVLGAGDDQVPSRAGRAALAAHRPGRQARGGDLRRCGAYAAALGRPATAADLFRASGGDQTWSSFGGGWRPVTIGSPEETPVLGAAVAVYGFFMFPVLSVSAVLGFGGIVHGPGGAGLRAGAVAVVACGALLVSRALARAGRRPSLAEFDGQVIRQWVIEGDDDTPTRHCVAIDDGTSDQAWALTVAATDHRALTPGTFVRARVNPRRNLPLSIRPTEPPPVAPRLAAVFEAHRQAAANQGPAL